MHSVTATASPTIHCGPSSTSGVSDGMVARSIRTDEDDKQRQRQPAIGKDDDRTPPDRPSNRHIDRKPDDHVVLAGEVPPMELRRQQLQQKQRRQLPQKGNHRGNRFPRPRPADQQQRDGGKQRSCQQDGTLKRHPFVGSEKRAAHRSPQRNARLLPGGFRQSRRQPSAGADNTQASVAGGRRRTCRRTGRAPSAPARSCQRGSAAVAQKQERKQAWREERRAA